MYVSFVRLIKSPLRPMLLRHDQNALRVSKLIKDYRGAGKSYRYIAEQLNELGVATAKAGKWFASTVRNYDLRVVDC